MSKKRFGNVNECSGFVRKLNTNEGAQSTSRWTLSPEVIEKNREIDENIRQVDVNVARSFAALA